jgi:AraC-like DNA-binding protein
VNCKRLTTHDWFHPDGFPIAVERREPQAPFGPHTHEFSELVIVLSGTGGHVTGQESWPLSAGDVFVISGRRPHQYRDLRRLCLVNVLFQPGKLRLDWGDLAALPGYHALFTLEPSWHRRRLASRSRLGPAELGHALGLVDELDAELRTRGPGFGFLATASFMRLVGYLARCFSRAPSPDGRALERIAPALDHLERHYSEPMDLDALARLTRMPQRSFMRLFRAALGDSPIAHLIHLRVNHAAALLRRSTESVTAIAFRVGFGDSNYFARQFRRIHGLSPREYRRLHGPAR